MRIDVVFGAVSPARLHVVLIALLSTVRRGGRGCLGARGSSGAPCFTGEGGGTVRAAMKELGFLQDSNAMERLELRETYQEVLTMLYTPTQLGAAVVS